MINDIKATSNNSFASKLLWFKQIKTIQLQVCMLPA